MPLVFLIPQGSRVVAVSGLLLKALLGAGVAATVNLVFAAIEEVVQLVAGHRVQPTAEGAAARVVLQPVGRQGNGAKDLLHQIGSVCVLEAALPRGPADHCGLTL